MKNKKYLVVILLVVLLIVVLALAWKYSKQNAGVNSNPVGNPGAQTPKQQSQPMVGVSTVPSAQIPPSMPANLPFETNAKILNNFTVKDPTTGKTQSTRTYVSQKTIDENFAIYQKYLQDNGWTVTSSLDKSTVKNLNATKASANLSIVLGQDSKGQVSVMVSYVQ
jgi:uncharacterized iron-regulated membrane protein